MTYHNSLIPVLSAALALSLGACCDEEPCTRAIVDPVAVNAPPTIHSQPDTLCLIGDSLRLQAVAHDVDGDEITYHLRVSLHRDEEQYRGRAFLDSHTGDFLFIPEVSDMPSRTITFIARDEENYSASTTFQVIVWPYYVDQQNTANPSLSQNVVAYSPIGQEFTPRFDTVDVVELFLSGGSASAEFKVHLRLGTITGALISEITLVSLPGHSFSGPVAFQFAGVVLIPNDTYVLELVHISGDSRQWMVASTARSSYPHGRQILRGEPQENNDLWFREGVWDMVSDGDSSGDGETRRDNS